MPQFIEDFSLFIKQCYDIVWNPKVATMKNRRIMLLSKCEVCDSKTSNFMKDQEVSVLLSNFGIKTPLGKIPLYGPLLF